MAAKPNAAMRTVRVHPRIVRLTHWVNAIAIFIMVGSGWYIYDNVPSMWLFAVNGLVVYLSYAILSGRLDEAREFRARLLQMSPNFTIEKYVRAMASTGESYKKRVVEAFRLAGLPE